MVTEQDKRDALAWLDGMSAADNGPIQQYGARYARTLKALLAEPRMPEEPSDEARKAMRDAL